MLIGLYLARQSGILTGLIFVGVAYVFWEAIGDPEYALGIYTNNTALITFVSICPQLFFLLLVPVIMMSVSSTKARIAGYILPITAGLVITNGLSSVIRPYGSFVWQTSWDLVFILLPLFIILMLFIWVNPKTVTLEQNSSSIGG